MNEKELLEQILKELKTLNEKLDSVISHEEAHSWEHGGDTFYRDATDCVKVKRVD